MPLNACSINTYSVDTICFTKRAKYIEILFGTLPPEPEPTKKGHGGWTGYRSEFDTSDEQKFDTSKLEHLYVTITTVFDGETVVTTWDNSPTNIRPLISINKLTSSHSEVQVTVNNLLLGKEE
jgi:hypothetical protein